MTMETNTAPRAPIIRIVLVTALLSTMLGAAGMRHVLNGMHARDAQKADALCLKGMFQVMSKKKKKVPTPVLVRHGNITTTQPVAR